MQSLHYCLLGSVPFDSCLALQRRLAFEMAGDAAPRLIVLLCEHEPLITVGRRGSRGHIGLSGSELRLRQIDVQWQARGGGCVLHGPGQIAVYPLLPLDRLGWTVGAYLDRLQHGLYQALRSLAVTAHKGTSDSGVWGRTGQLVSTGVAVRHGVSQYGCYVHVNPPMGIQRRIRAATQPAPGRVSPSHLGAMVAERRQGIRMSEVRAAIVEHLSAAFDQADYQLFTGHPFLAANRRTSREPHTRVS